MKNRFAVYATIALGGWGCGDGAVSPTATCTYSVFPSTLSVGGPASTATVNVNTGSGCTWNANSNAAFITVSGGGTGSGSVTLTIASNAAPPYLARAGTATVAGQTVTVSQADH